jgi:putative ABC transport system permease protein
MFYPRLYKVFRDLWGNKSRTIVVILAIAVGVLSFGSVFTTRKILISDMQAQYLAINPSSLTLSVSDADPSLVSWIRNQPEVVAAHGKSVNFLKAITGGNKQSMDIVSMADFTGNHIDTFRNITGEFPPGNGQIILERASLANAKLNIGDTLSVQLPDDRIKSLKIVGTVQDLKSIPPQFALRLTGYVSRETLSYLGFSKSDNQIDIIPYAAVKTENDVITLGTTLLSRLSDRGISAGIALVFKPGEHWAKDIIAGFVAILEVIGIFSLILSGFLVITTITGVITQQRREIGIMKAVGARVAQIVGLYLLMVAIYGLLALFIAVPLGLALSYVNMSIMASFLNIDIIHFYLPPSVLAMEVAASVLVPAVSALFPIYTGAKITVREAIYVQGAKVSASGGWFTVLTRRIASYSRPLILAIRNTFRKKGRLALTLGTLTLAGAFFICVMNAQRSMFLEIDRLFQKINFDIELIFDKGYDLRSITSRVLTVPQVSAVEGRIGAGVQLFKENGTKGAGFQVEGLPVNSDFIKPAMTAGRWLAQGADNEIVVASELLRDEPNIAVGKYITLEINNRKQKWLVVGIIFSSFGDKTGYVDFNQLIKAQNSGSQISSLFMRVKEQTPASRKATTKVLEDNFKRWDINVVQTLNRDELQASIASRINILVYTLLSMATLIAIVGGLGLAGTMSLNVLERTREIGVMRSLGASNMTVRLLVIIEGLFVGIMSFIICIPISIPLTIGFNSVLGLAIFQQKLQFSYSMTGLYIWFLLIIGISVSASLLTASRAAKLSIRETLAYE